LINEKLFLAYFPFRRKSRRLMGSPSSLCVSLCPSSNSESTDWSIVKWFTAGYTN